MEEEKVGIQFPEKIEGKELQDTADWLNGWADFHSSKEALNGIYITEYGRGYEKAISDVMEKLRLNWKQFDKRTKTGFKK